MQLIHPPSSQPSSWAEEDDNKTNPTVGSSSIRRFSLYPRFQLRQPHCVKLRFSYQLHGLEEMTRINHPIDSLTSASQGKSAPQKFNQTSLWLSTSNLRPEAYPEKLNQTQPS